MMYWKWTKEQLLNKSKKLIIRKQKKYHPDANKSPDAQEKFAEINEAYQVLSNSDKRSMYDRFGHDAGGLGGMPGGPNMAGMDLNEIFSNLFGGKDGMPGGMPNMGGMPGMSGFPGMGQAQAQQSRGPQQGQDIEMDVSLGFMDAVDGCKQDVKIHRYNHCVSCGATGVQAGSTPTKCSYCSGTGMIQQQIQGFMLQQPCNHCEGAGERAKPCKECQGNGLVMGSTELEVTFPAGVADEMKIRVPKQGHAGKNQGPRGHVFLKCRIQPHEKFTRDGCDISVSIDVPAHVAMLGGKVDFATLKGEAELNVKPGTQPGTREIIRGKGIRDASTGRMGHQYLNLNIVIPKDLTSSERELLEQFRDEYESRMAKVN